MVSPFFCYFSFLLLLTNSWGCRVVRGSLLLGRLVLQPWELSMGNDDEKEGVVKILLCSLCRSVVGVGEGRWLYL